MDDAELKRLAEAATPGPWRSRENNWSSYSHEVVTGDGGLVAEYVLPGNARFIAAANPATILRLLRERDEALYRAHTSDKCHGAADLACQLAEAQRDEARARLASAQHDVEVYRDAVIEARELARDSMPRHDLLRVDLLRIFEDLHSLPALDADQGEGEGA